MTSTHEETPAGGRDGGPSSGATGDAGPQLTRDRLQAVDRLRRSRTDRHVAGVAGGLGAHFGIDPVVLRVLFVVATFFGGAGLVLYIACWLLVPEEGHDRAAIHTGADLRRVLLASVAVIAAIAFLGNAWGGFDWPVWPLCAAVILFVVVLANRRQERRGVPTGPGTGVMAATTSTAPTTDAGDQPPYQPTYTPAPSPRRTGTLLFWPTLALVAVALGALGFYAADHHVAPGAWAALALAVIGAMLVLGAFVGRPGGLIALGVLTLPILVGTTVVGHAGWHDNEIRHAPTTAADVRTSYDDPNGRTVLDLSGVADPAALDGRSIDVSVDAGEIRVVLPSDVTADVTADLRYAGDISVLGDHTGGLGPHLERTVAAATTPVATVRLDLQGRVGHIEIDRSRS